ncbi:MAG TPA: hypothetical protein VE981_02550 [Planctomycetota bacterium]|nr:hypothetical protein [Planctomycetota bacterium]
MRSFTLLLLLGGVLCAQDYQPFSRACVVDGYEVKAGFTMQYIHEGQKYIVGFCCTGCRTKFLQGPKEYFETALAAAKAGLKKKDKKLAETATGPCDCKRLVKVPWCISCQRELGKDDILPTRVCKRCENKPILTEFCVKVGETEDRARVTYLCETCKATADLEIELKHEEGCKPKLKKVCSKSGTAPHATEVK